MSLRRRVFAMLIAVFAVVLPAATEQSAAATAETVVVFGDAAFKGSTGAAALARPITDVQAAPSGGGYWLAARDGGVFAFGTAPFWGSMGAVTLNQPVVGMAATPSGQGYWLAAADGGVFAFGDARFLGSMGAVPLNEPIVAMAASPSGNGYWLVASDGGIFAFGDAGFFGSTGALTLKRPVVGMAARPTGGGYWLVGDDGGVFAFGDAPFRGSIATIVLNPLAEPMVDMAPTPSGNGYWLVASDGGIFAFGDARFSGSAAGDPPPDAVVGMAATPTGNGYWLATTGPGFFPGFWPVSSPAAAAALQQRVEAGRETWRRDPASVARAFAREVLGWEIVIDRVVVLPPSARERTAQVLFRPLIGEVGRVPGTGHALDMTGLRTAQTPVWFPSALFADDIEVRTPTARSFVASPLRVSGNGVGFEATLLIAVRDDSGRVLHPRPGTSEGFVMGGATEPGPFDGLLVLSRPTASAGTLTVAGDTGLGTPSNVTIVRLRF